MNFTTRHAGGPPRDARSTLRFASRAESFGVAIDGIRAGIIERAVQEFVLVDEVAVRALSTGLSGTP